MYCPYSESIMFVFTFSSSSNICPSWRNPWWKIFFHSDTNIAVYWVGKSTADEILLKFASKRCMLYVLQSSNQLQNPYFYFGRTVCFNEGVYSIRRDILLLLKKDWPEGNLKNSCSGKFHEITGISQFSGRTKILSVLNPSRNTNQTLSLDVIFLDYFSICPTCTKSSRREVFCKKGFFEKFFQI